MDKMNLCLPVVSAIIEREKDGEIEILIQTRWKFDRDPIYSGTIEIPAGKIPAYKNVYDALTEEIFEETGLNIIEIHPNIKTKTHCIKDDGSFAFQPFCCQQQTKNGQPWIGFVFICKVKNEKPKDRKNETKDVRWIKKSELKNIFEKTPEKIFTLQLGVLDYYFKEKV
jgi:8-oxo-dGTP pyrophosphatase MutT (NUDIX family)